MNHLILCGKLKVDKKIKIKSLSQYCGTICYLKIECQLKELAINVLKLTGPLLT